MTDNAKAVAKSLHTITVIQQVAALHAKGHNVTKEDVALAMETLGLANRPDPYGLADKALRLMEGK